MCGLLSPFLRGAAQAKGACMRTITVADVLADIKRQLLGIDPVNVLLSRQQAEHLHQIVLDIILERDDAVAEIEKLREARAQDQQRIFHLERALEKKPDA